MMRDSILHALERKNGMSLTKQIQIRLQIRDGNREYIAR